MSGAVLVLTWAFVAAGCYNTPVETSDYVRGPTPLHNPSPVREAEACKSYEDSLTGGQIFKMYCGYCHNAPSLAERPYAQFRNVAAHMRVRANLTGKEYARLMEFLRRWNDVPPPSPPVPPTPKKFIFSQPLNELQPQKTTPDQELKPPQPVPEKPKEPVPDKPREAPELPPEQTSATPSTPTDSPPGTTASWLPSAPTGSDDDVEARATRLLRC
jgi:hypothetical protein